MIMECCNHPFYLKPKLIHLNVSVLNYFCFSIFMCNFKFNKKYVMKNTLSIGIFFLSLFLFSCSSTSISGVQSIERTYSSVIDYLQTVSGIRILGSGTKTKVVITSVGTSPLYVIDGQQIGNTFRDAEERVNPNDIKRVKVWSVGDATIRFGINGSNGAIEFIMKK